MSDGASTCTHAGPPTPRYAAPSIPLTCCSVKRVHASSPSSGIHPSPVWGTGCIPTRTRMTRMRSGNFKRCRSPSSLAASLQRLHPRTPHVQRIPYCWCACVTGNIRFPLHARHQGHDRQMGCGATQEAITSRHANAGMSLLHRTRTHASMLCVRTEEHAFAHVIQAITMHLLQTSWSEKGRHANSKS